MKPVKIALLLLLIVAFLFITPTARFNDAETVQARWSALTAVFGGEK